MKLRRRDRRRPFVRFQILAISSLQCAQKIVPPRWSKLFQNRLKKPFNLGVSRWGTLRDWRYRAQLMPPGGVPNPDSRESSAQNSRFFRFAHFTVPHRHFVLQMNHALRQRRIRKHRVSRGLSHQFAPREQFRDPLAMKLFVGLRNITRQMFCLPRAKSRANFIPILDRCAKTPQHARFEIAELAHFRG